MLDYLVSGRARRELLRLLWGRDARGSVSALSRMAGVAFSAAHRELDAMRRAGLACVERAGAELVYRANGAHPQADLLRQLVTARAPDEQRAAADADRDGRVRGWLASVGAPLGAAEVTGSALTLEEGLAEALSLAHRDPTVARVLPLVLWRQREHVDFDRLQREVARRDEDQALGLFLELAGKISNERQLMEAATPLRDRRRRKPRVFFSGPHGPHALAATRRSTPPEARRWGFLMNMGMDSFRSTFAKFARR